MIPFPRLFTNTSNWTKSVLWAAFITVTWFFFWYWPWQTKLDAFIFFRLGMGLILFTIPGFCIYGIVVKRRTLTLNHISFGFVISHLVFAILGTLGRFTHLSFEAIKMLMAILGLILLLFFFQRNFPFGISLKRTSLTLKRSFPLLMLILVALIACLIVVQRVLTDDDLTYLAYITNWQHSTHLDFNDVIFGEPSLVSPRFWLISIPFAQALLADISKVPGILIISGYYEPFLVILSVLSWYGLARTLRFSPKAASISSILQLSFLLLLSEYLHPGAPFFTQISSDKATAAYILVPVFLQSLICLLENPQKTNAFLLLITGMSLTLMHPIIVAYAVFIGGIIVLLNQKAGGIQKKMVPIGILLIILLPQVTLRVVSTQVAGYAIPFNAEEIASQGGLENMITWWRDTSYYGLNLNTLSMNIPYEENIPLPKTFVKWGWTIIPVLSAILAIKKFRDDTIAQFILASFLLCLLVIIPFTGWIIGYFLSAYMLERAIWLFPFGLSTVYILLVISNYIKANQRTRISSPTNSFFSSNWILIVVSALSIGLFFLHMSENNLPDFEKFTLKSQRYQGLATAGQALDHQISEKAFVIGSPDLNDLIPGLSRKSKPITFRISDPLNMLFYTPEQRNEKISDSKKIFSKSLSAEEKMTLIEKHHIEFVFLQPFDIRLFTELIDRYPNRVKVTEIGGVIIIKIHYQ